MPFHVECNGCHAWEVVDCNCPPDVPRIGGHPPACDLHDFHTTVTCKPGAGCCGVAHDHAAACNGCKGEHEGTCAVEKDDCAVCRSLTVTAMGGMAQLEHDVSN